MLDLLKYADARLREPSTWASLAVLLGALHVSVDPGLWASITLWGTVGAGGLGVLLSEVGTKPASAIADDVLAALLPAAEAAFAAKKPAPVAPAPAAPVSPAPAPAAAS